MSASLRYSPSPRPPRLEPNGIRKLVGLSIDNPTSAKQCLNVKYRRRPAIKQPEDPSWYPNTLYSDHGSSLLLVWRRTIMKVVEKDTATLYNKAGTFCSFGEQQLTKEPLDTESGNLMNPLVLSASINAAQQNGVFYAEDVR